jgi:quercetin dioxygenase-like cupin family protein
MRPGGAVYIEPGEEHWRRDAGRFMAHVAIQEAAEMDKS